MFTPRYSVLTADLYIMMRPIRDLSIAYVRYYASIICVTTYESMLRAACAINMKLEIEVSIKT